MSDTSHLVELAAYVVSAYVGSNSVPATELPAVIASVHEAFGAAAKAGKPVLRPKPAVAAARSVKPDYIICLEDGKRFRSLEPHLKTAHKTSPEDYRAKWALPEGYPMVAPGYAAERSAFAKKAKIKSGSKAIKAAGPDRAPLVATRLEAGEG